jgi:alpha-mannosidase
VQAATVPAGAGGEAPGAGAAATGSAEAPAGAAATGEAAAGEAALTGQAVALLNRGTPGCVVTADGTLNMSLMRSCSGWPAGVWIDQPTRTAPDGSSFNYQHWTHTFGYALASTAGTTGDWRDDRSPGFTGQGQDFNHPLIATEEAVHPGNLPAAAALMEIATAGQVPGQLVLSALKPHGNPHASGRAGGPRADGAVTVRVREARGRPAELTMTIPGGIASARRTDLLEERDAEPLAVDHGSAVAGIAPFGVLTAALAPAVVPGTGIPLAAAPGGGPAGGTEPAQPVFARYWLHGKGPAPAGGMPVAVSLSPVSVSGEDGRDTGAGRDSLCLLTPQHVALPDGGTTVLRLTVAAGPDPVSGAVEVEAPDGLPVTPSGPGGPLLFDLPALGHGEWMLRAGPAAAPGRYFVSARITDPSGQVVEDVVPVAAGEPPVPRWGAPLEDVLTAAEAQQQATEAELDVAPLSAGITVAPGGRAELAIRLASRVRSPIRGEAQLLSPFGSWGLAGPWAQGFTVGPGGETTARFTLMPPADARPGSTWWAVVKIMYFGRLRYTESIPVSVSGSAQP